MKRIGRGLQYNKDNMKALKFNRYFLMEILKN